MRLLIVDDEAPARQRLRRMLAERCPGCEVLGEAASGEEALAACRGAPVDLVLMDIRMPGIGGLEAAAQLAELATPPAVIFVTAYEEHALAAFESQAVDYLLKPIRGERLEEALRKARVLTRPQLAALRRHEEARSCVTAHYRGGVRRIPVDTVLGFQADQKYTTVFHDGGETLLEDSLVSLEERFGERFLRVHRNALVAKARLAGLDRGGDGRWRVLVGDRGLSFEVSRRHLAEIRGWLKGGG